MGWMDSMPGGGHSEGNKALAFFFIRILMKFGMKNPYEVKKLEFSPELLLDKATAMRSFRNTCDQYALRIRRLVGELEALWKNDIQSSLVTELGSMWNSLADYSELVEEYAAFLDFAAEAVTRNPGAVKRDPTAEEDTPVKVDLPDVPNLKKTREELPADEPFGIPAQFAPEPERRRNAAVRWILVSLGLRRRIEETAAQKLARRLNDRALELRSAIIQYNYHVRKTGYAVEALQELWENDAQSSLIEELGMTENTLKDYAGVVEELATLLEMAARELDSNAVDTDKASVLASGADGPVTVALSGISYLRRSRIDLKAFDPYFERTQEGVSTVITATRKNAEYIYTVYEDHIELIKYIGMYRTVAVPRQIDGLPVTHIGLDCFAMAWRVRFISVTIPDSVTTIYHGAFRGCQTIREMNLPTSLKYIGNYAFAFLTDLEHVTIPDGVVSLGMGAFRNCEKLREIIVPPTVIRIGKDCFYTCKKLERAVIGGGTDEIDDWAFRQCEHLSSVTIGPGVRRIGESAFYDDVLLMRLDIPETVRSIGTHAFYHRRGITLGVTPGSTAELYAREANLCTELL